VKKAFREINFRDKSREMIETLNEIVEDYQGQGLKLTLRQLYYQCVSRDLIPNSEKSYKSMGGLISDARLAGLMDWDAIEDRGRRPREVNEYSGLDELARAAIYSYRLPRWEGQEHYAELWVEKEALSGVLQPLASRYHVTMMVNKGYSSQSSMYESALRFVGAHEKGKSLTLFYLGDHDPSGEDMVRDIRDRLTMFGDGDIDLHVEKLALTMAQIREYNPPPNPAKISDSRAKAYIEKHGNSSWEVDALPPQRLSQIVSAAFDEIIDVALMDDVKAKEERDKAELLQAVSKLMKKHGK
jgi:hypothetical protein